MNAIKVTAAVCGIETGPPRVDVVWNGLRIWPAGRTGPLLEMTADDWDTLVDSVAAARAEAKKVSA